MALLHGLTWAHDMGDLLIPAVITLAVIVGAWFAAKKWGDDEA